MVDERPPQQLSAAELLSRIARLEDAARVCRAELERRTGLTTLPDEIQQVIFSQLRNALDPHSAVAFSSVNVGLRGAMQRVGEGAGKSLLFAFMAKIIGPQCYVSDKRTQANVWVVRTGTAEFSQNQRDRLLCRKPLIPAIVKIGKHFSALNLRSHSISTFNRYDRRISTFNHCLRPAHSHA